MSLHTRLIPDVRSKGQIFNFSEYGQVAHQIKGNDACINMVAYILPTDTSSILGGQKV